MPELPRGTVTFLFTDIEGSTRLWERDRAAMAATVERHQALLGTVIAAHDGVHFKTVGDAVQAAFPTAPQALAAAVEAQRSLLDEDWSRVGNLRVRMAVHAGEAEPNATGDYQAPMLNRLSRLLASGHGGQVLLTQAVQQLARGALPAGVELIDLGSHRLRDLLEPERVFQLCHPALPDAFPPLRTLEHHPNNLPLQPTPFLGRMREVSEVVALLRRPDVRFLTLTGPGGTGKTRLAMQAAAELLDDFADGVYFVPLSMLTDATLVSAEIGGVLGIREDGVRLPLERVRDYLASKVVLLVVDNFEHVADAAPLLGDLLGTSPQLRVLATSRMPLRLRAEHEYPVLPLGLPRRKPPPSLEALTQYEAVQLFIERAQAVTPGFAVDNQNAPAVAEICWRLDGLPLAIELAAARVRLLPPQAMLARLEKRLPLLIGGARDAPARQQTLRQTIGWSFDLLGDEEQAVFRRMAVFAAGATLEAAEAVANPAGDVDVLKSLERLVEQSLVRQDASQSGEPRFSMLETIREFAREQLAASTEDAAIHGAHARFYLELVEEATPFIVSTTDPVWFDRLEIEHDNLLAALAWLADSGDVPGTVRLAGALGWFWYYRGYPQEGRTWLERALAMDEAEPERRAPATARAQALASLGLLALTLGAGERAVELFEEGASLWWSEGDTWWSAFAESLRGGALISLGRYDEAHDVFTDVLPRWQGIGDQFMVGHALFHLGLVAYAQDDREQTRRLCQQAVELYDATHCELDAIDPLHYLGLNACADGDLPGAATFFAEALNRLRARRSRVDFANGLADVATLAVARGNAERAARLFGAADALQREVGRTYPLPARIAYSRAAEEAREQLGAAPWSVAFAAGTALLLEDALAEAEAEVTTRADRGHERSSLVSSS